MIDHAADAVGATVASLSLKLDDETMVLAGLRGGRSGCGQRWATFSIDSVTPAAEVARTGRLLVLRGADAIAARYPTWSRRARDPGRWWGCRSPSSAGRSGVISLSFPGLRELDAAELEFFAILADSCAQAIVRIDSQRDAAAQAARDAVPGRLGGRAVQQPRLRPHPLAGWPSSPCRSSPTGARSTSSRTAACTGWPSSTSTLPRSSSPWRCSAAIPRTPSRGGTWEVIRTGQAQPRTRHHRRDARGLDHRPGAAGDGARPRAAQLPRRTAGGARPGAGRDDVGDLRRATATTPRPTPCSPRSSPGDVRWPSTTPSSTARPSRPPCSSSTPCCPTSPRRSRAGASPRTTARPGAPAWAATSSTPSTCPTDGSCSSWATSWARGVAAAASMAQMRAAIRAYVVVEPDPALVGSKLDELMETYDMHQLVTLVLVVIDPARNELHAVSAGHPPPVVIHADGSAEHLEIPTGAPLGVLRERPARRYPPVRGRRHALGLHRRTRRTPPRGHRRRPAARPRRRTAAGQDAAAARARRPRRVAARRRPRGRRRRPRRQTHGLTPSGAPGRTRTCDQVIRSDSLCPAELRGLRQDAQY